jgi:hypothetical protein
MFGQTHHQGNDASLHNSTTSSPHCTYSNDMHHFYTAVSHTHGIIALLTQCTV